MSSYQRSPKQVTVTCPHCKRPKTVWFDATKKLPTEMRAYVWMQRHIRKEHADGN
jgi:hypothetical protein